MQNFRCIAYANVKKDLIFRSEGLFSLTDQNVSLFSRYNIKTIIDLRSEREQNNKPDPIISGVNHIALPLMKKRDAGQEIKTVVVNGIPLPDMAELYRQLVAPDRKEVWTKIFNLLLDNNAGILFHCSEGKDRTGVVSAIILSALGVERSIVINDYLLTNESPLFKTIPADYFEGSGLDDKTKLMIFNHFKAHEEYLSSVFDEIEKIYGSMDSFLFECCSLDDQKLEILKKKYLI